MGDSSSCSFDLHATIHDNTCRLVACGKSAWWKSALDRHLIGMELSEISYLILITMLVGELLNDPVQLVESDHFNNTV